MTILKLLVLLVGAVTILPLVGQTSHPNAYSVTEKSYFLGKPANFSIYRAGSKVLIDRQSMVEQQQKYHVRILYDLETHSQVFWELNSPAYCQTATFKDDEPEQGDPFGSD